MFFFYYYFSFDFAVTKKLHRNNKICDAGDAFDRNILFYNYSKLKFTCLIFLQNFNEKFNSDNIHKTLGQINAIVSIFHLYGFTVFLHTLESIELFTDCGPFCT